ncbi:peptide/nickel transport system substrate-binding protein [Lipingzhangella halophila]|uniref:Peptide/nickel transport system substrate-binding protein n=1 Tax=Lipingzhangella halophila TaxID=1783352 RepID=A0A7W7RFY4_9ACTN|nr:ABC transporter substrate-binding protein [Lipingzhangella halophila]MBB4931247.1 peptide/nickel transport system substrate-binding protein [Lipingzhangella halophila]
MRRDTSRRGKGRPIRTLALAAAFTLTAAACQGDTSGTDGPGDPEHGGELTVILDSAFAGDWSTGLDPATSNSTGANLPQNSAVFGGLFTLETDENGENPEIVPNQAESYEWSEDGLTLTVTLREGIEFSDGTPLDAEAVVWNWVREFNSGSTGTPQVTLDLEREVPDLDQEFLDSLFGALPDDVDEDLITSHLGAIRAVDDRTVEMHLAEADGSLVNGFPGTNLNLMGSPSAYAEMGPEEFSTAPVGAGPFVITENQQNERLELERNEDYFKDDLPYLDTLTFQSVGGDQVAYQTLQAGDGDVVEGLSDVTLIEEAQNNPDVDVHLGAPTSPYVVQLNTREEPFDDKQAREAIYYATDFEAINEGLFNDQGEMSQSFTASGGLFHHAEVPGYREYDPEKAEEIVDELGGLEIELTTTDLSTARQVTTALQTQWQEAGIDVEIDSQALGDVITTFQGGEWQSILQTAGAWDPAAGIGVGVRFGSTSPYSGTPLPEGADSGEQALEEGLQTELDEKLEAAVQTLDEEEREEHYRAISEYIAEEAYGPFGPAFSPAQVMRPGVHGPGLDVPIPALAVNQGVLYDRVWVEQQ